MSRLLLRWLAFALLGTVLGLALVAAEVAVAAKVNAARELHTLRVEDAPAPAHKVAEFDTATEAAVWAFTVVYKYSPYYEYGGVVVRLPDGKYTAAVPATDYAGDHVEIETDPLAYPASDTIVATYHTHPCLPKSHFPGSFSPEDLKGSRIERYLAYMADLCTGDVHLFDPATDKSPDPLTTHLAVVAGGKPPEAGRIVGHFPVTGTPLE